MSCSPCSLSTALMRHRWKSCPVRRTTAADLYIAAQSEPHAVLEQTVKLFGRFFICAGLVNDELRTIIRISRQMHFSQIKEKAVAGRKIADP